MLNDVDRQNGERVKRFRTAALLSIEEVAKACGLSPEDYEAGEAGDRTFAAAELLAIGNEVGFTFTDVLANLRVED